MSTIQELFVVGTQTITIAPENQATSSTLVGGRCSAAITNVSTLDLDHLISGFWTTNSAFGVNVNTQVQVWVIPCLTDDLVGTVTYPTGMTPNANSGMTTSMQQIGVGKLGATLFVDTNATSRAYYCADFSVAALFGGVLPTTYLLFITHNTGQDSNATAGNFVWQYQRIKGTVT